MSDERRDDEITGRALGRAIETIDLNETPFEESRMVVAPHRSGFAFWQLAGIVATIIVALAIGAAIGGLRGTIEPGPAAASPTPAATVVPTSGSTASPPPTTAPTIVDRSTIYLARPALPPIGVAGPKFGDTDVTAVSRIASRVTALRAYRQSAAPPGLVNYLWNNSFQGGVQVVTAGELATVDLVLAQSLVAKDHAEALAILQQLVYTATEEPGIRRVFFTQNGAHQLTIGDIRVDKPLAREDVAGYTALGPIGTDKAITWGGNDSIAHVVAQLVSVRDDGSTTRLAFRGTSGAAAATTELPSFSIDLEQNDDTKPVGGKTAQALNGGKYQLRVDFQWNGGGTSGGVAGTTIYDQTPLRSIVSANPTTLIELDDARPWRAYMPDKTQLVVEIGGDPRATSDRISVTAPKHGDRATGEIRVTGSARLFEANVVWRLKDASGKAVANGHFNASLGSSPLWGTFDTRLAVPAAVHGSITLELYEASPKDGSEQGLVAIPLSVS